MKNQRAGYPDAYGPLFWKRQDDRRLANEAATFKATQQAIRGELDRIFMGHKLKTYRIKKKRTVFGHGTTLRGVSYKRTILKGVEQKFHNFGSVIVPTTGGEIVDSINIIAQGSFPFQRVGRKVHLTSFGWRWRLKMLSKTAANDSSDTVRIIIYLDTQCNGTAATVLDLLDDADFQSFNRLASRGRFRTLMDRTYTLTPNGALAANTLEVVINDSFYKKLDIDIEYDGVTGALSEITSNNIGMLMIGTDQLTTVSSNGRIRYTDY